MKQCPGSGASLQNFRSLFNLIKCKELERSLSPFVQMKTWKPKTLWCLDQPRKHVQHEGNLYTSGAFRIKISGKYYCAGSGQQNRHGFCRETSCNSKWHGELKSSANTSDSIQINKLSSRISIGKENNFILFIDR